MAKKDGENFDDDLDLSSFDDMGDFDKNGFDDFSMDEEKDRKPVAPFIREVNNYPGLLDIIVAIEGLVNKRSSHASGVILYGNDPYDTASFMRTPSGDLITCYDLHKAEAAGDTKYDFLVTEISDKLIVCIELLMADGLIEQMSLRDCYEKYLHPEGLDTSKSEIWEHLAAGDILDVFQFSTGVGLAIAKKLKPQNPMEMTAANAMMRLMSEKDKESQQDRYVRIQNQGLDVFDREMDRANFTPKQKALMHKHCDQYWGCCALQEQMMELLMDVASFTLGEANNARKIVGKKQMSKIPELHQKILDKASSSKLGKYVWENGFLFYDDELVIISAKMLGLEEFEDDRCIISELGYCVHVSNLMSLYVMSVDCAYDNIVNKISNNDPEYKYYSWSRFGV